MSSDVDRFPLQQSERGRFVDISLRAHSVCCVDQLLDLRSRVSAVQCYLDLQGQAARGEEAAEALLETVIKPQWQ